MVHNVVIVVNLSCAWTWDGKIFWWLQIHYRGPVVWVHHYVSLTLIKIIISVLSYIFVTWSLDYRTIKNGSCQISLSTNGMIEKLILVIYMVGSKDWPKDTVSRWFAETCSSRCSKIGKGKLVMLLAHCWITVILKIILVLFCRRGWKGEAIKNQGSWMRWLR